MSNENYLNFVVIGAMKAGTTSLYSHLSKHSELSLPYTEKEVNFFNNEEHWKDGLDWYRKQFLEESRLEGRNFKRGEINPNYAMFPRCTKVPERLHQLSPDVRIIYVLRDPIERLLSHVHHNYIKGFEKRSIAEILSDSDDSLWYVAYSKYYYQIEKYLKYFSPEQMLLVTSEELLRRPDEAVRKILDFIAVNPAALSVDYGEKVHVSDHKVKPGALLSVLRKLPISAGYQKLKPLLPADMHLRMKRSLGKSVEKPVLQPDEVSHLERMFSADINQLRTFSGLDFSEWKHRFSAMPASDVRPIELSDRGLESSCL